jgi:hypothetical protein
MQGRQSDVKRHNFNKIYYILFVGTGLLIFISLLSARSINKTGQLSLNNSSSVSASTKAVYLVQGNGALSVDELEARPDIVVVDTFAEFQRHAKDKVALWIDKNAVSLVSRQWIEEEPQRYYPLVLVGYNDTLYSFREVLPLGMFYGPIVDWSKKKLEPGFSVIQIEKDSDQGNRPKVVFLKGYNQRPRVEDVIDITNALLEGKLRSTQAPYSSTSNGAASPTPP